MQVGLTGEMSSSAILVPFTQAAPEGCCLIIRPLGHAATPGDPKLLGRVEEATADAEPFPQVRAVSLLAGLQGGQPAAVRTCGPGRGVWTATAADVGRYEAAYGAGVVASWGLVTG